jgi:hypothetical protein
MIRVCIEQQDILPDCLLGDGRCGPQYREHEQDAGDAAAGTGGEQTEPTRHAMGTARSRRHVRRRTSATASSTLLQFLLNPRCSYFFLDSVFTFW